MFSDVFRCSQAALNSWQIFIWHSQMCSRCVQIFSDVFRWLGVFSNEWMEINDPKEFNDHQAFDDQKGIAIESMDFDNPKVYGDTSIFDDLVGVVYALEIWLCLIILFDGHRLYKKGIIRSHDLSVAGGSRVQLSRGRPLCETTGPSWDRPGLALTSREPETHPGAGRPTPKPRSHQLQVAPKFCKTMAGEQRICGQTKIFTYDCRNRLCYPKLCSWLIIKI